MNAALLLFQLALLDPCTTHSQDVLLETSTTTLYFCHDKKTVATFSVNLGAGGVGKKRKGDRKTPLGEYRLSPARASRSGFTWFVPIGYPTRGQRAAGYTGGSIGIHGPPDWLPKSAIDAAFHTPWTDGCVMLRTTEEITAIKKILGKKRGRRILIQEKL